MKLAAVCGWLRYAVALSCIVGFSLQALAAEPGVNGSRISIGLTAPLSGPLAPQGLALRAGLQAAFDAAQAEGGLHGRQLRLVLRDDTGDPTRSAAQTQALLNEGEGVLALTGFVGSGSVAAAQAAAATGVPVIGLASAAEADAGAGRRMLYFSHAGVRDQISAMLLHIDHLGIEAIGLIGDANPLGQAAEEAMRHLLTSLALRPAAVVRLAAEPADAAAEARRTARTAQTLRAGGARAALLAVEAARVLPLIRALRAGEAAGEVPIAIYLLHDAWTTLSAQGHAAALTGVAVAQALPSPAQQSLKLIADFRRALAGQSTAASPASDPNGPASAALLEGYLSGRLIIEALRRCPREPLRACVADALDRGSFDFGGYRLQFNTETRRGSRWVDMGLVNRQGRLVR